MAWRQELHLQSWPGQHCDDATSDEPLHDKKFFLRYKLSHPLEIASFIFHCCPEHMMKEEPLRLCTLGQQRDLCDLLLPGFDSRTLLERLKDTSCRLCLTWSLLSAIQRHQGHFDHGKNKIPDCIYQWIWNYFLFFSLKCYFQLHLDFTRALPDTLSAMRPQVLTQEEVLENLRNTKWGLPRASFTSAQWGNQILCNQNWKWDT